MATFLAMLLTTTSAQDTNLDKVKILHRALSATVKVYAEFDEKTAGHGTGVAVMQCWGPEKSGYKLIMTNSHVVSLQSKKGPPGVAPYVAVKPYQKGDVKLAAYVLWHEYDEASFRDIAYLVVPDPDNLIGVAPLPATRSAEVGARVYACGNPQQLEFFADHGKILDPAVADYKEAAAAGVLFHDALIERGNSGGGLFNAKGELIGINTWLAKDKYAMAQDVFRFFQDHRFGMTSIDAMYGRTDALWSEYLTKGQGARAIAFGSYTCSPGGPPMTPAGLAGLGRENAVDPNFRFGSLLFSIAGTKKGFDFRHAGADGDAVKYHKAVLCDEIRDVGRFNFELNDKNVLDNRGRLFVVYLVTGPVNVDVGLQVADPSPAEREANRLWLALMDNAGKEVRRNCGVKVVSVAADSEAAAAGLKAGDFILTWAGPPRPIQSADDLAFQDAVDASTFSERVRSSRTFNIYAQHGVPLGLRRGGEWVDLKLRFGVYR